MTSPSSMHETGHSKLVLWDNSEGCDGEGGGKGGWDGQTHVHPWLIPYAMAMYDKNYHNIVK